MAPPLTRRILLRSAMLTAAVPALSATAAARASTAALPPSAARSLRPFGLEDVALGAGVFAAKRQLMLDHARGYDVNRLLQVFRANAGLSTLGAVAPGGWEGLDGEANGNLRGHYTGHFLTMLSQAYASTAEQVFADRIRTAIGALTEVREALRHDPAVLSTDGRFGTAVKKTPGPRRASPSRRAPTSRANRAVRSPSGDAGPPSRCGCACRPGRRPASG
ncbi:beta-L-arabinofuranosidase (glycosyl hydrolase family 127) [Streptomyces sp. SLBN-115]|nr:beta-L-arabinofuranosidase (glycosyl hydrolase family 127) [Streptomyces sp. SLBN-115]